MRILGIDAAAQACSVAIADATGELAARRTERGRGQHNLLPQMAAAVLAEAGPVEAIAVTVGPGSFTGLRASLALAHGLAAGGMPVVGVTVAEALAAQLGDVGGRATWVAIDSRRGRIFLDRDGDVVPAEIDQVPMPAGPVALCGDAAAELAEVLRGQGADVLLTEARRPDARDVCRVARRRLAGEIAPLAALPLYVDPPEAKLPAGGLRPAPRP